MARDGSGTFNRPVSDYVFDTVISETDMNAEMAGIAAALSASVANDGQTPILANLPMSGFKHTGVADGTSRTDYASVGQLQDDGPTWCGVAGGTANALTLSPSPAIAAYAAGQRFFFKAGASPSSSTVTIAVSGLTTKAAQINDAALSSTVVVEADKYYVALYDGTAFQLTRLSPAAALSALAGAALTRGKVLVGNSSGLAAEVGPGSANQAPVSDGTDITMGDVARPGIANTFTKRNAVTPVALTSSSNHVAVNMSLSNNFSHTFTENTTLDNPSNPVAGTAGQIAFTQHASSAKTLAFGSQWIEATSGSTPSVSTTVGAQNLLSYYVFDTTHIYYVLNKHGVS